MIVMLLQIIHVSGVKHQSDVIKLFRSLVFIIFMNELPYELIDEILSYLGITCHSCYNIIKVKDLNNVIKLNRFYYCDKRCFDFV